MNKLTKADMQEYSKLIQADGQATVKRIGFKWMKEIEEEHIDWLWYPYIPMKKVTIIQGDPGGGKTMLILNLIAALSRVDEKVFGSGKLPPPNYGNRMSLYITAEDGYGDTVVPRLKKANADLTNVFCLENVSTGESIISKLMDALAFAPVDLVVLDPIQAFFGNGDMNRANDVREIMATLGELAEVFECAIVLIGHLNKKSGENALYRGLGSIDFIAAARSVLQVAQNKAGQRVVEHIKSSLAPKGESMEIIMKDDKMSLEPYEPLAVEGRRETQATKAKHALQALCVAMGNEWWSKAEIETWLRMEWQITSVAILNDIKKQLVSKVVKHAKYFHVKGGEEDEKTVESFVYEPLPTEECN